MIKPDMPLVSVVTPSYNAAAFIRETIESVRSQDYPAIEHIVIDGGSTDGTVGILRGYPHLTWVSERDRGQSDALNKGFRRAQGEIVGWLNADDIYLPGAIRIAVAYLLEHPDVAGAYSDCPFIDEKGREIFQAKGRDFDLYALLLGDYIPQPTVFLRRSVFQNVGLINEDLHYVMDWEYWLRIGARQRMAYLPQTTLAAFRLCPGTKSADKAPLFDLEYISVLDRLFNESPFNDMPQQWRRRAIRLAKSRHQMALVFSAHEKADWRTVRRALPRGILHNPSWLANRGVISIALEAFAGGRFARWSRKASHLIAPSRSEAS